MKCRSYDIEFDLAEAFEPRPEQEVGQQEQPQRQDEAARDDDLVDQLLKEEELEPKTAASAGVDVELREETKVEPVREQLQEVLVQESAFAVGGHVDTPAFGAGQNFPDQKEAFAAIKLVSQESSPEPPALLAPSKQPSIPSIMSGPFERATSDTVADARPTIFDDMVNLSEILNQEPKTLDFDGDEPSPFFTALAGSAVGDGCREAKERVEE